MLIFFYLFSGLIILFFLGLGLLFWVETKSRDLCTECGSSVYWFGRRWFCENPRCFKFSQPMVDFLQTELNGMLIKSVEALNADVDYLEEEQLDGE